MIKWRNFDEFENDLLAMGGMHRAMNFMGDIGHIMQDSGFEDALIEAEIFGPAVTSQILRGKSYNRGVRCHKIMQIVCFYLKWNACLDWAPLELTDEEKVKIEIEADNVLDKFENILKKENSNIDRYLLKNAI